MELHFEKKFNFTRNSQWKLPDVDVFFSGANEKYEPLQVTKRVLNFVKQKLDDYKIEEWSAHTRLRNPANGIVHHLKNNIKAEFVTQAFAKFFECLSSYPMIPPDIGKELFTVHLCEAPGAFITATNHYLALNHPHTTFDYRATTLNPYYEGNSLGNTILDDRFILHTLPKWFFGESYTGDILDEGNIRSLIDYVKSIKEPQLVTGDGSIDCLDKPEIQEEYVSKLHTAELITSLAILADGGSLLLKYFTFFETSTIAQLYVLNCCFKSVHVFKPGSSKEGNSEVYVIGIGYQKSLVSEDLLDMLISGFNYNESLLPLSAIPRDFLAQVLTAAKYFMNLQVDVIEGNIRTYKNKDQKVCPNQLKDMRIMTTQYYVDHYNMRPIPEHRKLLRGAEFYTDINKNTRTNSGSFTERNSFHTLDRFDQLQVFYDRLKDLYYEATSLRTKKDTAESNINQTPAEFIRLTYGAPIKSVMSSKFALIIVMKYFNDVREFEPLCEELANSDTTYIAVSSTQLQVDITSFLSARSYDKYEKNVVNAILEAIIEHSPKKYIIKDLFLPTQFLVGIFIYLGSFVYEEMRFDAENGEIELMNLRPDAIRNVRHMLQSLEQKEIIGICDMKLLFSNDKLYRLIVYYNNILCLKYCSHYLNLISK